MTSRRFDAITTLTFDIFGTVLDLTGSLEGPTGRFLNELGSDMSGRSSMPSGGRASGSSSSRIR